MLFIRRFWWLIIPTSLIALTLYRFHTLAVDATDVTRPPSAPTKVNALHLSPQSLTTWVFSEGTVQAQQKVYLDFEMAGKVESIATQSDGTQLREGSRVFGPADGSRNGQLLAQIDNRDNLAVVQGLEARLQSMRAQKDEMEIRLLQAENERQLSQQNFERMAEVYERGVISQDEFERIKTANLNAKATVKAAESNIASLASEITSLISELNRATFNLEKTSLFAPFDGVITAMNISENNHYYPPMGGNSDREREATSAIVLVNDSLLEVQLEINVNDAKLLSEGQIVYLASDDERLYHAERDNKLNDNVAYGVIWSVSPSINLQRRTQTVKVRVEKTINQLQEGQFVRAWIAANEKTDVIALPLHALSFSDGKPFVFVIDPKTNSVERRNITIGSQGIDRVEISSGLAPHERIVVRGQHLLIDNAIVEVIGENQ
ncbi:efflux RND transporter periplasmic adaptor subunit [Thaumasiovibrio sp. DFM-14]|uniref:efflux RND transporter periplasmic adaptor subunit n=1 Tax=Thaumasiovibrio sp. DFM-14 TaxID=3384792 RepID=UPI0039A3280A